MLVDVTGCFHGSCCLFRCQCDIFCFLAFSFCGDHPLIRFHEPLPQRRCLTFCSHQPVCQICASRLPGCNGLFGLRTEQPCRIHLGCGRSCGSQSTPFALHCLGFRTFCTLKCTLLGRSHCSLLLSLFDCLLERLYFTHLDCLLLVSCSRSSLHLCFHLRSKSRVHTRLR